MAFLKRAVKRIAKKAKGALKKRYVTKTGKGLRVNKIASDVMMLKKMINAEKKTFNENTAGTAITVGQVVGNASGHQILDITPRPAQGTTSVTRNGNSIKLNSGFYELYMTKQTGGNQANKVLVEFWKVPGEPYSATEISNGTAIADLFSANEYIPGANIYDLVSSRKQGTFTNFKRIGSRSVYFPANDISGVKNIKLLRIPMKFGHHIKFASDGSQTIEKGQILMTMRAENGNKSTVTANTLNGVSVQGVDTGISLQYNFVSYFIDN